MKFVAGMALSGCVFLAMGICGLFLGSNDDSGGVTFSPSRVSLGRVEVGEASVASLYIKNGFDSAISIEELGVSCGCTSARMASKTILPLTESKLSIEVKPITPGAFHELIHVGVAIPSSVKLAWYEVEVTGEALE